MLMSCFFNLSKSFIGRRTATCLFLPKKSFVTTKLSNSFLSIIPRFNLMVSWDIGKLQASQDLVLYRLS